MDRSADYPPGVSTGALLLALTWGFALGAPLAGVFAVRMPERRVVSG